MIPIKAIVSGWNLQLEKETYDASIVQHVCRKERLEV